MKKSPKHLGNLIGIFVLIIAISIVPNVSFGNAWHGMEQNKDGHNTLDIRDDAMVTVNREDNFDYGYDDYVNIKRTEHPENGTIDWEVDFMPRGNIWTSKLGGSGTVGGIKHVLFLPHMEDDSGKSLTITRRTWFFENGKNGRVIKTDYLNVGNQGNKANGVKPFHGEKRWRSEDNGNYPGSIDYFNTNYRFLEEAFNGTALADTVKFWRKYNVLEGVGDGKYGTFRYCLNTWENRWNVSATYNFTTHHGKGTDLSKVVLIAGVRDYGGNVHSHQRHFRIDGPVGIGAIARMDMRRDVYVDNKLELNDKEKAAIEKTIREDSAERTKQKMNEIGGFSAESINKIVDAIKNGTVTYDVDKTSGKVIAKMNLKYNMSNKSGKQFTFNQPVKLDITERLKPKRLVIQGSEATPKEFTGANSGDVMADYVKVNFDYNSFAGGKLVRDDGKKAENSYYILKGKEIAVVHQNGMKPELGYPNNVYPGVEEKAKLENNTFSHWAWTKDGDKDAFKPDDKIFYKANNAKGLESKTLYAVYKPVLKVVLHNGKNDKETTKTKEIQVTKDMFKDGKGIVPIDQPYYSKDTPGNLGKDFTKDDASFVGWTIKENLNPPFGDHLVDNANQVTAQKDGKYMVYTLSQLKAGTDLKKVNGKFVNPPYLPAGFKLVLDGDLDKIAKENKGVINLYANYKSYITVTAHKSFKKYDWKTKKYTNLSTAEMPPVYMGLLYRTHVTNFNDPTVHTDANYHPLKPKDYGRNGTTLEDYQNSVLKKYDGNNTPTWRVRGYDEFGVRLSYALVEVPDEYLYQYMHFSNDWYTLGVQIFHRIGGQGKTELDPNAPLDPWDNKKQVAKLQTVSIPNPKKHGEVDVFTAATTRKTIQDKKDEGTNNYTGYEINVVNIPVDIANPNVDAITHGDKEAIIRYTENTAVGAKNVDKIHVKYTPHGQITYQYELIRNGENWTVQKTNNAPDFKAEFIEKDGKKHGAVRFSFTDPNKSFYCTDSGGEPKTDIMTVANMKGQLKSTETPVTFEPLRDSNGLVGLRQEKNVTENGKEYTVVSASLPSPVLYEAKQGTIYTLVNKKTYDSIKQLTGNDEAAFNASLEATAKNTGDDIRAKVAQAIIGGNVGYHYQRDIEGDTYYLKEALPSNKRIYFKIPKGAKDAKGQVATTHGETYYILSVENKKKPVFSKETVTLDTKAELEKVEAIPSPSGLKATIKATVKESVGADHKIKISYLNKEMEFPLSENTYVGTSIAPLGQDVTVTYTDYFGNKATQKVKGAIGDYITLSVVRPRCHSPYVYVNRTADSQGAIVTVKVIGDSGAKTLNEVSPGRFKLPNGQKLQRGDIIDVSGTLGNKHTAPYRIKVR